MYQSVPSLPPDKKLVQTRGFKCPNSATHRPKHCVVFSAVSMSNNFGGAGWGGMLSWELANSKGVTELGT